ncbi:hypothetical protein BG006_005409 [Podila minutissima]|uniref:Tricalbin n=1 Tax=Podila minutissima TaxID=64525 RepID=A0A9P5VM38_9FUNG|nr:hypothetical protein BG006_005409 [Podila minutissima]
MTTQNDTVVPFPPDISNDDSGLDPGRAEKEHPPGAPIPGQARLNETVGRAVGGTVIPSDIHPSDMPAPKPTGTTDDNKPVPEQTLPPTTHQNDKRNTTSRRSSEDTPSEKQKTTVKDKLEELKNKTVGAYPVKTQIGWLDAYKRTDGSQNEYRDKAIWMEEFASSVLFGAFWHNAAAVIVIPVVCFVVFKLGGGFVSMILIIAFGATYYKNSIRRFRRNARDDITRELIRNTIEDQVESTEWLNNFLSKFWIIYEPVLSATIVQTVDSILVDSTPGFLDSIRLTEFTLGTKAPRVESIKTYPKSESDLVMMDWRVTFAPTDIEDMTPRQLRTQINPKIVLTIRVGKGIVGAGMPILVEDMSFSGIMRIKLKLTSNFPHIKMFDFSFLETPTIDYVLKPVGGDTFGMDIAHIPGLQSFVRDQTHAILGPMMYAPNVYAMDLEQMMTGGASLTAAIGIVQFTIYDAKDLKNSELIGNSDPYVKLRLGNRPELATTAVQENTLNPVWNETNIILINNLNEVVCMEVFDRDNLRKDRPLGQANFDLKSLEEDPIQDDVICKVFRNAKERGSIRIRAAFFPVQKPKVTEDGSEDEPVASNSGILAVNLAQAKDIARTGKTKSLCEVSLNGKVVHSTRRVIGANPAWASDLDLFITDLENAQIHIDVISEGKVLGYYDTSTSSLLKDTENKVDWVTLKGGDGAAKLKMTGVWKPILMGEDLNPSVHKAAIGVARVRVFAGKNLRNVEIGSSSDPYVAISGNKGIVLGRTKTINNNLNPSWDEIHYVPVNSIKQAIDFTVFDYEKLKKDRSLGRARFDMNEIVEEQQDKLGYSAKAAVDRWAPLMQKDGTEKGELHYEVSFFPSLKLAYEATEQESKTPVEALKVSEPAVATDPVAFPEGESLKAQATSLPPGTIQASEALSYESGILVTTLIGGQVDEAGTYCEFYVDSDNSQYKSQRQRSKSPKWNEVVDIFVKELEYAKLSIVVKEKSSMEKDPIVGTFTGNVRQLLETTPREGGLFDILDKNDKCGTLRLKFEFLPVPITLLPRERLDNMGNLTINLVRAKDLVAADRSGASDPYFVFRLNGKDVYKSEAVKKSLNPEYNESFVVPITSRVEDQISFEVFDWNQLGSAKSLGTAALDLRNVQLVLPNEYMIPLKNKQNQGQVQLRIKFMPEFLSSTKRKSGFGSTFVGAAGAVGSGGQAIGRGMASGVGVVGQGAADVTGAVGMGAVKGVGAVGKGVLGGISAGASAIGLHKKGGSDESPPSANAPNPEGPSGHVASSSDVGEPGNLTLHVIEADGLLGVDKSGTSDPYVKVCVGEQSVLKTKVKKETLTPVWNESASMPLTGDALSLSLVVKDHNNIGSNKDLGTCELSVWDYIQPGSEEHPGQYHADFWVPLGGSGGRVHLAFEFEPAPDGTGSMRSTGSRSKRLFSRK